MKLTSEFTSVRVAAPHGDPCPNCNAKLDWRREWHGVSIQPAIVRGQLAINCPKCGYVCYCKGDRITKLPQGYDPDRVIPVRRSKAQAEAVLENEHTNLETWINEVLPQGQEEDRSFWKRYIWKEQVPNEQPTQIDHRGVQLSGPSPA